MNKKHYSLHLLRKAYFVAFNVQFQHKSPQQLLPVFSHFFCFSAHKSAVFFVSQQGLAWKLYSQNRCNKQRVCIRRHTIWIGEIVTVNFDYDFFSLSSRVRLFFIDMHFFDDIFLVCVAFFCHFDHCYDYEWKKSVRLFWYHKKA